MRPLHFRACVVLLATIVTLASTSLAAQQKPLFSFHSNAWLNLHFYVRAAARGGPAPTGLTDAEQKLWTAGVEFYKPYAQRDVLLDDGMVAIKNALSGAEGKASLDRIAIDPALKAMLERLMPVYQRRWWPQHDRGNREWIAAIQPLLDRHGAAIGQSLPRTYDTTWPREPIHVDVSVLAGPVGAFATNDPLHVMISSTDASHRGYSALETVFHEASHGLSNLFGGIGQAASAQKVSVPPQLWHAVLFYTAGELTRRELEARGISYTPYANAAFYATMCGAGCRDKIAEHWTPRLDGKQSIPDALSALVVAFR
jgi:hypothetical protein